MSDTDPNAIDLTTVQNVKSWAGISNTQTDADQIIQDCITSLSLYVMHLTSRGPADGSVPTSSPFVTPVNYDEFYDGTGTGRLQLRNWPITSVTSVNVDGVAIPQSTSVTVSGWVVDGDKKFLSMRGGTNPTVATFQNYRGQYSGRYVGYGFSAGAQNVEVVYTAGFAEVPFDLEMAARKIAARNYKRRGWIGMRTMAMANGAGTTMYDAFEMADDERRTIFYYRTIRS